MNSPHAARLCRGKGGECGANATSGSWCWPCRSRILYGVTTPKVTDVSRGPRGRRPRDTAASALHLQPTAAAATVIRRAKLLALAGSFKTFTWADISGSPHLDEPVSSALRTLRDRGLLEYVFKNTRGASAPLRISTYGREVLSHPRVAAVLAGAQPAPPKPPGRKRNRKSRAKAKR